MLKGIFNKRLFPVSCTMRDVPCKVSIQLPRRFGHAVQATIEQPTRNWKRLQRHIEAQIKAGGKVELTHRRLDEPVQAKKKLIWTVREVPGKKITEVVDVRFSRD
jgi:hypothetical protein